MCRRVRVLELVITFSTGVLPLNQQRNDGTNKKHDDKAEQSNDDIAQSCRVVEIQVTVVVSISPRNAGETILRRVTYAICVRVSVDEGLDTICIQLPIVGCCLVGIGELETELSLPSYESLKKE